MYSSNLSIVDDLQFTCPKFTQNDIFEFRQEMLKIFLSNATSVTTDQEAGELTLERAHGKEIYIEK